MSTAIAYNEYLQYSHNGYVNAKKNSAMNVVMLICLLFDHKVWDSASFLVFLTQT